VAGPLAGSWGIELLDTVPGLRGPTGASWFNDSEWSGVETSEWVAWVSNTRRAAAVWGVTEALGRREALTVVIPAVLRREGLLDGHGAVIAPDRSRPHDGVFVSGLSGAGKSSLTVSSALAGARFVSDDSVAIGLVASDVLAWARRSSISLTARMYSELLAESADHFLAAGKVSLDARTAFPNGCADFLKVRAVAFLARGVGERTRSTAITPAGAYQRLLMGHPILAVDTGARRTFAVVRRLASLPCYDVAGGSDLLEPQTACETIASLLPPA